MRRKKERFEGNQTLHNVLESGKKLYEEIKGKWNSDFFKNDKPLVVELACGKGEYTVGLAKEFPDQNHIGVDIKGDRIWIGSKRAEEESLANVAFLRTKIELLENFFEPEEISELWITFPDPRPKGRDIKRRLTSPRFLDIYKGLVKKGGWVKFKTDSTLLFDYTLEVLSERKDIDNLVFTHNLYHSEYMNEHHGIKTNFEKKFYDLGEQIKYLKFQFVES